jgi:hypothetical protein
MQENKLLFSKDDEDCVSQFRNLGYDEQPTPETIDTIDGGFNTD